MEDREKRSKEYIDQTLRHLNLIKEPPKWTFVLVILLYGLATFFVQKSARSQDVLFMFGMPIPKTIFTGVYTALANLCIIFLVVFYKKAGFIATLILLFGQVPSMVVNLFVRHNAASIPGFFTNFFTIVASTIIYISNTLIEKFQKRISYQAVTDSLTDLPNRFACTQLMEDQIKHNLPFTIVSIDINNFKSINDTMGHEIGNKVLVEVANRWKALADSGKTNTTDFVTRLSGDEFSIVIRGYKFKADILNSITAYKDELEKPLTVDDCDYFLTASFGCAEYPADAISSTQLFSCADAAMHEVKRQNSSRSILRFTPDLLENERSLETERKIRNALNTNSVFLNLQPQYDINHNLRGFEALARMKDTDGSLISPVDFIPVAEKTGLVDQIDLSIFKQAAAFLAKVLKEKKTDITVSFNVSVRHFMKNNFIEEIKEVIRTSGVPANNLEMEITESIMIDSAEKALQRINDIKAMGIKVAIDDFGTGYSSLSYLNKLPSDLLKIDKSFIDAMNTSESSKQYVASIVSIGHILNLKVISEGVEQPEQLATLKSIGCDYIQGYLWGKPLPAEEAEKLV